MERAREEVMKFKGEHKDGALIQQDWGPYKKEIRQGCKHAEKRPLKPWQVAKHLQAKERRLRKNQTADTLNFYF